MKKNGSTKISQDIIRSWLDTVMNPIYEGLTQVNKLLQQNNYSWDWANQDLTEIGTLLSYMDYRFIPNFEQLVNTEFKLLSNYQIEYDEKRDKLKESCSEFQNILISSSELKDLFYQKINEYQEKALLTLNNANYLLNTHSLTWLSNYLINNLRTLPDTHILRNIWNNESFLFFKILENEEIQPYKIKVDENGDNFKEIANKTFLAIKEKSNELSLKYGVPIVV